MEHKISEKACFDARCFYCLWLIFCEPLLIRREVHRIFCKLQKASPEEPDDANFKQSDFPYLVQEETEIHSKEKPDHASDLEDLYDVHILRCVCLFPWAEGTVIPQKY